MESEKELLDQPQSNETSIENEDDFFEDVNNEINSEDDSTNEQDNIEGKPTEDGSENEQEMDYEPFLKVISEKAKYNKEAVRVDSMDDVIANFQKGLNYDKLVEQKKALENSRVFSYVDAKAKELGMTVDEYMEQVELYERQQEEQRNQQKIDEMIENGVPEDVAKEVVATSQLRKQLQQEKNELEQKKRQREMEETKDKEYLDFLESFPDVKAEDIPKEVFFNAKKSSLKEAYLEYQNAEFKKQLEIMKNNQKNADKNIGSVTETGSTNQEGTDPFLEGFNSI